MQAQPSGGNPEDSPVLSIIVAVSENGVIGRHNAMPWHIPGDLKRFKRLTSGHPVIMGRKTFESIFSVLGRPLPERTNIIVSRSAAPQPEASGSEAGGDPACVYAESLEAAIKLAREDAHRRGVHEVFIIGGAQIYAQALMCARRIYMTRVHRRIKGDAYFPELDRGAWRRLEKQTVEGDPAYSFITLER